ERLQEARRQLEFLRKYLDEMYKAMEEHESGSFPVEWCSGMMTRALKVYNEVARANGAVLVRGTTE
ncbi:hypothetical protein ACFL3E_00005, partial [Patescibacteria group bacterium]